MAKKQGAQPTSSQWAGDGKTKAAAQPAAAKPGAAYTQVTLSRAVEVKGHLYRPNATHMVNASVLAALGDAVMPAAKPAR